MHLLTLPTVPPKWKHLLIWGEKAEGEDMEHDGTKQKEGGGGEGEDGNTEGTLSAGM